MAGRNNLRFGVPASTATTLSGASGSTNTAAAIPTTNVGHPATGAYPASLRNNFGQQQQNIFNQHHQLQQQPTPTSQPLTFDKIIRDRYTYAMETTRVRRI